MKILAAVILAALVAGCAHQELTCETNTPPIAKIRVKPAGSFIK